MTRPRILLADGDTLVREGLKKLLELEFDVVGMVENGRDALRAARELRPDAVLLELLLPLLNGIEVARRLKKSRPAVQLIVLTSFTDQEHAEEAFRAGVSAYLLKRSAVTELVFAIREALAGRYYVTPEIATDMLHSWLERFKNPQEPPG